MTRFKASVTARIESRIFLVRGLDDIGGESVVQILRHFLVWLVSLVLGLIPLASEMVTIVTITLWFVFRN